MTTNYKEINPHLGYRIYENTAVKGQFITIDQSGTEYLFLGTRRSVKRFIQSIILKAQSDVWFKGVIAKTN